MSLQNAQPLDLVLHTDPSPKSEETEGFIEYCRSQHIGYAFLPPVFADSPHQLSVEHLGLLPIVSFHPTPLDGWGRVLKRAFDAVIALALLLALLPALLLIALTVLLNTGWPIFYRSTRVGEQGRRLIPVWKFRSMVRDADAQKEKLLSLNERRDGPLFKMKADPRITRIGRVLRRWSLDELPQLWNVVLGHMSLVGPRPHLPDEVGKYTSFQRRVFAVRPGLTGLAQVSGRSDLTFEEEVRLDLQYIEEWSLLLDIWILWRTASVILNRKGAD
jgi:exopolysaccharide biosynthesis polyprenyl glycosylphosphotransferase